MMHNGTCWKCNADLIGCCGVNNHGCSELFRPRSGILAHHTKRWLMLGHVATCNTPDVEAAGQHVWVGSCESNGRSNRIHVTVFSRDHGDGALVRILDEPGMEADEGRPSCCRTRCSFLSTLHGLFEFVVRCDQLLFTLCETLQVNLERCQGFVEISQKGDPVGHLDENTTHLSVKCHAIGLRFHRCDGSFEFLYLSTDAADLLTCGLYFCNDELELVELCHALTVGKTESGVQECFPKTCSTESVAIRPRKRVFHMARRSLQAASWS